VNGSDGTDWFTMAQVILLALSTLAALATVWAGLQRDREAEKLRREERDERNVERLERGAERGERRWELISERIVQLGDAMYSYNELAVELARMKLDAALAFTSEHLPATRNLVESARVVGGPGDHEPWEWVRAAIAELQEHAEKYESHGLKLG
jgi:hypothetical protein